MEAPATAARGEHVLVWAIRNIPLLGGLSGLAAIGAIMWSYAFLPTRVAMVEAHDQKQDSLIEELQKDATQRREILASVMATLTSIDSRTRRIEDHLINIK